MKHEEILKTEYKEQYNQYRWIGHMQSVVLTFYGAVVTFSLLIIAALSPKAPAVIDYAWIAVVLLADGLLGIFVGLALFRSRSMQRRTAWYLTSLLYQMANTVEDTDMINESALRFRTLISTGGRVKLIDTMNTAFFIALISGEALFICGIAILCVEKLKSDFNNLVLLGIIIFVVAVLGTLWAVQRFLMNAETGRMTCDYSEAEQTHGLNEMRKKLGMPDPPNPK